MLEVVAVLDVCSAANSFSIRPVNVFFKRATTPYSSVVPLRLTGRAPIDLGLGLAAVSAVSCILVEALQHRGDRREIGLAAFYRCEQQEEFEVLCLQQGTQIERGDKGLVMLDSQEKMNT